MSNLQKHHRRVWRIQIVIKINEILENLISDFAVIKDNTLFTEIVCDYQKFIKRMNENVRGYFCPRSGKEMEHFGKTSTEIMRRKQHSRCGKVQPYVADTKGC